MQSIAIAKSIGKSASDALEEMIRRSHESEISWSDILKEFMTSTAATDHTWRHPNRRFVSDGLYLPSMRAEGMPPIVFVIDTSGSMSTPALDAVWGEVLGVIKDTNPEEVIVIHADDRVNKIDRFDASEAPETIEASGRGGTAFAPAFAAVEDLDVEPACMIYLTDLYCNADDYPKDDPDYPVLWATFNGPRNDDGWYTPRFGERIDVVI